MLHLITDRRRLAGTTDLQRVRDCLFSQARFAAAAGVDVIQIRERDLDARILMGIVGDALRAAEGTASRVIVNDRVDVALASGAHGVHLPARSLPVAAVRAISPRGFVIGRSVHNAAELEDAAGADYVIAGTVWATVSKPEAGGELLGAAGLAALVTLAPMPVIAIGGVDRSRFRDVAGSGAAGAASIGLFLDTGSRAQVCRAVDVCDVVAAARRAFDTPGSGS